MATTQATDNHDREPRPEAKKVSYASLPHKGQLAILCIARLADPLAQTSIQLKFFDPSASATTISTQAGILVGAKTAAQVCTGMLWGRLADSSFGGRKIVLLIGLTSCCISYIGYGLSRSFIAAVLWQVMGGALSSNVAITRCVVAELNPEKRYRTRALLLLPLFANAGNLIGPLIGGLLSSNARAGAATAQYPYLGPNLFVSATYALAAAGVLIGLEETSQTAQYSHGAAVQRLWTRIKQFFSKDRSGRYSYMPVNTSEPASPLTPVSPQNPLHDPAPTTPKPSKRKRKLPFWRIWTSNVVCTMISHFIIAGHVGTFSVLWAMFLSTPIGQPGDQHPPFKFNGGIGMLPRDVGFAMSLLGATGVLLQLVVYPRLQDRFGTIRIWRSALMIFPIVYILSPFPSLVACSSVDGKTRTALVWLAVSVVIFLFIVGRSGVTPATTLLINDCTPHPSVRGTIHTAATVIANLSRSIFPVAALALFGYGLQIGVVGLGFWFLAGLAVLAYGASTWVREGSNGQEIVLEDSESEEE